MTTSPLLSARFWESATAAAALQFEFDRRQRRNPRHSLRSFARAAEVSVGHLSEVLRGKVFLSPEKAESVAERLWSEGETRAFFVALAQQDTAKTPATRQAAAAAVESFRSWNQALRLSDSAFRYISDWYHLGMLTLLGAKDAPENPEGLARRLGISRTEALDALERLVELGLVAYEGEWVKVLYGKTVTHPLQPGPAQVQAIRKFHQQLMEKGIHSLRKGAGDSRDITGRMFAFDKKYLPEVRARIAAFRQALADEFADRDSCTEVYSLCVQFFPLLVEESR